jgi:hypothetical protein
MVISTGISPERPPNSPPLTQEDTQTGKKTACFDDWISHIIANEFGSAFHSLSRRLGIAQYGARFGLEHIHEPGELDNQDRDGKNDEDAFYEYENNHRISKRPDHQPELLAISRMG